MTFSLLANTIHLRRRASGSKKRRLRRIVSLAALLLASSEVAARADDLPSVKAPPTASGNPWSGYFVGGHLGYAWGDSSWSGAGTSGNFSISQPIDIFKESGSFVIGVSGGYNYVLPNFVLLGAVVDASFPSFPNVNNGLATGGVSNFISPTLGAASYGENVLMSGTARARIGYAPGPWLVYATGGLAWTRNQQTLAQQDSGTTDSPYLWRLGWVAGAGVETPILPNWTASLEYLYSGYGSKGSFFAANGTTVKSDFSQQELRAGVTYHFGDDTGPSSGASPWFDSDRVNFHAQATSVWQGYPSIRSPYEGQNSLPGSGQGRETVDLTLFAGVRLWQGAELWFNPEIDQGFGLSDTHGAAGFPSAESYKLGAEYPYARIQRLFIRQTLNLGGESQNVDADLNQFSGTQTANRVVLTLGRFAVTDIFDTNKYSNNAKGDFLNWANVNAGTFDYAGDGWGLTYGAAGEWYQDRWTLRAAIVDLQVVPGGGALNQLSYALDPTFNNFQMLGEIEERHELWGQPGKLKITGYLSRGRAGQYLEAVNLANETGIDASLALAEVRKYQSRPGVSANLEQQVNDTVGFFARIGWANPNVEPWSFTDVDAAAQAGFSVSGKLWNRPDDTVGIAGALNRISGVHESYFNAGGLGILIGDGQLPNPGLEEIFETYYSYALTSSTKLGLDYQLVANPAYNTQRGPANVFAGRIHWQF
jgi:high affinity Mn2+ porin